MFVVWNVIVSYIEAHGFSLFDTHVLNSYGFLQVWHDSCPCHREHGKSDWRKWKLEFNNIPLGTNLTQQQYANHNYIIQYPRKDNILSSVEHLFFDAHVFNYLNRCEHGKSDWREENYIHKPCVGGWEWVIWIPPCLSPEMWVCNVSCSVVHQSDMEICVWNVTVSYIRVIWVQTHTVCRIVGMSDMDSMPVTRDMSVWCQSQCRT